MKVVSKQYWHLSPAVGCALAFSEFIVSLHCYGPPNVNTAELVRNLFWRPSSAEPFRPTRNKSLVGTHLTPSMIGHLIGVFESNPSNVDEALLPYLKVRIPFSDLPAFSRKFLISNYFTLC
jgi:hypothetical protein